MNKTHIENHSSQIEALSTASRPRSASEVISMRRDLILVNDVLGRDSSSGSLYSSTSSESLSDRSGYECETPRWFILEDADASLGRNFTFNNLNQLGVEPTSDPERRCSIIQEYAEETKMPRVHNLPRRRGANSHLNVHFLDQLSLEEPLTLQRSLRS